MKLFSKRNLVILGLALCVCVLGYWYAPVHFVRSNPRIESLIDQLASSNSPPVFLDDPPHFFLNEFLENPRDWDPDAQRAVSVAYYELKSLGKEAFPYLIKHLEDKRYSHERSYSTYISHSVGDACGFLIAGQVAPGGPGYKSRDTPTGTSMGNEVSFERYVKSKYGSYAAWWRNNRHLSLVEMRLRYCNWHMNKQKQLGFVDEDQESDILGRCKQMLDSARTPVAKMPFPVPDGYTIDAIVGDREFLKQFEEPK